MEFLTVAYDIEDTNSLIKFSPDPKLAGCVTQPPMTLAVERIGEKTVRFVKNLHVVDNGKGHYKDGNKQIRNCQTDQEHVGQLPDEDSFMKPVVRVWVFRSIT